jgi:two-component system sensor histidine kinase PhcS
LSNNPQSEVEVLQTYADYERQITLRHLKVGCYLVMLLMPLGVVLDYFVYPAYLEFFFTLRLFSAGLLGLLPTPLSQRFHNYFSLVIVLIPTYFICWMIYATEGADSPYYAGLNLILLCVALVMRWTVRLSIIASFSVTGMYLSACFLNHPISPFNYGVFLNNMYFLVLTGVVVVAGGRLHRNLRISEFTLRFELDQNKKTLEQKTADLEDAIVRLKEAEAELVQTEKLASLGRMSAGIIHEINNPLNYAKTGLYTLRNKARYLPADQQAVYSETVKDVEDGLDRVKNIVSDLRGFTTHSQGDNEEVSVADLVEVSLRFVSHEWGDNVQLQKNLPAGQVILANKNKLIQVCVNILENALDALKEKAFPAGEQPTVLIEGRVEENRSVLCFRDNGPGIKPEHLDKIFDPFFTTKDVGEGMGLGLTICYRIVQEYKGHIRVRSEPGKFCEFTLEFPTKG